MSVVSSKVAGTLESAGSVASCFAYLSEVFGVFFTSFILPAVVSVMDTLIINRRVMNCAIGDALARRVISFLRSDALLFSLIDCG